MKNNKKTFARRALALLLAVMMCFSMVMSAAATDSTYKLCTKDEHTHEPECYKYSFLDCKHTVDNVDVHGEACSVELPTHEDGCPIVGTKGVECGHTQHDNICGYIAPVESKAEVPCNHPCSQDTCGEPVTDEDGKTTYPQCTHAQDGNHTGCAYQPAIEGVEGHECLHGTESDPCSKERCGYVEAVEADPEAECQCQLEERTAGAIQQCTHLQGTHTAECYGDFKSWDELTADQQAIITGIKNSAGATKFSALADQFGINSTAHIVRSAEAVCGEEEHIHAENNCITKTGDTFTDTDLESAVSNGGTIDLGGQTVDVNATIEVGSGKTVTFTNGTLKAVTSDARTALANVLKVVSGGTLNLGSGATVDGSGTARGVLVDGGTLTMEDGSTIRNGKADKGAGVKVQNGSFTMNGGVIENNHATVGDDSIDALREADDPVKEDYKAQGGGVYVDAGSKNTPQGKFYLKGGTISGNTAAEGGGVMIGKSNSSAMDKVVAFEMTGGIVSGNTAIVGEGGGIYIKAAAKISRGLISGNNTLTDSDLGGGGIYVENSARLDLVNALITDNKASGLGAGLAACVHGKTVVLDTDGAAIFRNTNQVDADGNKVDVLSSVKAKWLVTDGTKTFWTTVSPTEWPKDANGEPLWSIPGDCDYADQEPNYRYAVADKVDQQYVWETIPNIANLAKDVLIGASGDNNGISASNKMLGTDPENVADWTGVTVTDITHVNDCPYTKGSTTEGTGACTCGDHLKFTTVEINDTNNSSVDAGYMTGLTANVSDALAAVMWGITGQQGEYGVVITGNYSATHGGGIGNNGLVVFGQEKHEVDGKVTPVAVKISKTWNSDDTNINRSQEVMIRVSKTDSGSTWSTTAPITGDGSTEVLIPADVLQSGFSASLQTPGNWNVTHTFKVTEEAPSVSGGTATQTGTTEYTFAITVNRTTTQRTLDQFGEIYTTNYSISSNGAADQTFAFTNKYERFRGALALTKVIDDTTGKLPMNEDRTFYFTVQSEALATDTWTAYGNIPHTAGSRAITVPVTVPAGETTATVTIDGLPLGGYTVTDETGGQVDKFTVTSTFPEVPVTVTGNEAPELKVTNTYDYARGTLIVSKTAQFDESKQESPDIDFQNKTYTFVITQTEGVAPMNEKDVQGFKEGEVSKDGKAAVLVLTGNESREITKLPVGTYHVIENGAEQEGYTLTVTGDNDKTETLTNGGTISFPVTNTYDYNRGSLTIKKVVDGTADKAVTDAKEYSFTVTTPNTYVDGDYPLTVTPDAVPEATEEPDVTPGPAVSSVKFTKGVSEPIKITGPGLIQIDSLPTGKYTITEADASLPGYSWSVSGSNAVVEVKTGETANSEVTNNYWVPNIPVTRSLNVNKIWEGDEESQTARPGSIQVQLYLNGAAYGSPVALSPANGWSHTWIGLPAEGALTVEELDVPDGYTAVIEPSGNTVTITNTYDEEIPDPTPPLGTPRPTATPTPTPAPSDPTPTPDPDEEIPDDNVPLGTPKPEPTPEPEEELPDPDVPKAPAEPEEDIPDEDIPDEDVPLASTPKTGDSRDLWYLLTFLSAAGLVLVAATGRKKSGQSK